MSDQILIADETLRDGEQQVGVVFSDLQKLTLADEILRLGADFVCLMPAISSDEDRLFQEMCSRNYSVVPDVPLRREYIDQIVRLGATHLTLFTSVSDILLDAKMISHEQNIQIIIDLSQYAKQLGLIIDFALEDASRAQLGYLIEIGLALKSYVNHVILCDTTGCLQPNLTELLVNEFHKRVGCKIGIHCHNDLGLAVDNTVQAVLSGATYISGTINGIGERAGNADLLQVLNVLSSKHGKTFSKIDYDLFADISKLVRKYARRNPALPLSKPAFRTQTGIHVNAMLTNPLAYSIFPNVQPDIWFGKYSGISNFKWLFEQKLKMPLATAEYSNMRNVIKKLSIERQKTFSAKEVIRMYEKGLFNETLA